MESNVIPLKFKELDKDRDEYELYPLFLFECIQAFEQAGFVVNFFEHANFNRNLG